MDSIYLQLAVAEGVGQGLVPALLDPTVSPRQLLEHPPPLPPAVAKRLADPHLASRAKQWAHRAELCGLELLTPASEHYPDRLRDAPLRPLVLFARGNLELLQPRPSLTVVGSRTPTPYGRTAAEDFVGAAASAGLVIWSGLAVGIDGIAHRTALAHEAPTVAVLAGGLDTIYPAEHDELAQRIASRGGLLLSEMPPGHRARRGHFPRRNRILAGASDATLVVEAGHASGSLHTARFAADHGVPVFAVPGPYSSPRSRGCHALMADGAQIASDPEDFLRRFGVEARCADPDAADLEPNADEAAILGVLRVGPRPSDLVQREAGLEDTRYLTALFALTTRGRVRELPGDLLAAINRRTPSGGPT